MRLTCSVVAENEAPSLTRRSTTSSGRELLGKNCCGTSFMPATASASAPKVAPMTTQRRSIAVSIRRRRLR
ncbi:hypothetical protein D3C80_2080470 [compost metagenome]